MKKSLMLAVFLAALGLSGCVAVPYDARYDYDYGPPVYVAPPSVVLYGSYGYYGGGRRHHHWR